MTVQVAPAAPLLHSPIGLVAGNGSLPVEIVANAQKRGLEVVVVAHIGETDPQLEAMVRHCTWLKVGQLGKLLKTFKRQGIRQATFAGGIRRTRLFGGGLRLDLRAIRLIARLGSIKDDVILRGIAGELEASGIEIFAPNLLLQKSVPRAGVLTRRGCTEDELRQARIGWEAARAVGALDIGQTVVVTGGLITAVEAVEGTDRAIRRAGELAGKGSVVVKLAKPQQDLRFDLPAVGPQTIESMHEAGATALVLEDERALLIDPQEVMDRADRYGIAIVVLEG